jgi:hypothetical protein
MAEVISDGAELLTAICHLLYGETSTYQGNSRFFKVLAAFRRHLLSKKKEAPTLPAIRQWLAKNPSLPRRPASFQFLLDFLIWSTIVDPPLATRNEEFESVLEGLRTFIAEINPKSSGESTAAAAPPSRMLPARDKLLDRLRPIAGTYQLIRPFTSNSDRYVLETMSINPEATELDEMLTMYSHTQPKERYRYRGYMTVNNKYCYGICTREHEDYDDLPTPRCIVMHVSDPEPCLSGIMLRGVSGLTTGKVAIGVPFLAIKTPYSATTLTTKALKRIRANLFQIEPALLVGRAAKGDRYSRKIFDFCDAIFSELRSAILNTNGFTLQTVDSDLLWTTLNSSKIRGESYFFAWDAATSELVATEVP